ncbi:hypothetical protein ACI01nite_26770 [Acetobacter cibinongensis]|uniref:Uncharacterized protein n=1 Tax=Acetobacter cibinongensis TaxID=146475 RepID=A0A0D6N7K9_9PROT|nr:hypothetical protein Abci_036_015 [Acetobacter cibinongensis]GEL60075.1 hypothetical protein ACI01nite_26770 [Acetobacter cibinongensis]
MAEFHSLQARSAKYSATAAYRRIVGYEALRAVFHTYRDKVVVPAYGDAMGQAVFWKDAFKI